MWAKALPLVLVASAYATPLEKVAREDCKPCSPQGASGSTPPTFGPDLKSLYTDVLGSVKDIHFRKRQASPIDARADGFCCRETLDCLSVQNLNIPMCYDKFTTQFAFPDGSFGSLTTGDYEQGGSKANLITGEYTKEGGEQGDIYAEDPNAKPNTATLSIPPQWTGTGVGSAIPGSQLGSVVLITSTIDAITVTGPTTMPESTIIETISGSETAVTTIAPKTMTGPTTIPASTTVITSTIGAGAASSSSKGAAIPVAAADSSMSFGMSIFTALMYAIYAL